MARRSFTVQHCVTPADVTSATNLFKAYTDSLDLDLAFQDVATELASMPGRYATTLRGCLLLARDNETSEPLGVVGLRALSSGSTSGNEVSICEMKRLYVTPGGRGHGVGQALVEAVVTEARRLGYGEVKLDTLGHMKSARQLYVSLGFEECKKYYETPLEGTVFMRLVLRENLKTFSRRQ